MTTMDTLNSKGSNFLTLLVENDRKGSIPAIMDDKGYYFVDRNGEAFSVKNTKKRKGRNKKDPLFF